MSRIALAATASTLDVPDIDIPDLDEQDVDASTCLELYGQLTAGVCVITVAGEEAPMGMTASTVTSLSLAPPLLLACLQVGSRTLSWVEHRQAFGVQLLDASQQSLASALAGRGSSSTVDIGYREVHGVPILPVCMAWSVCRLEDTRRYGDHVVIVGRVVAAHVTGGSPLVWHDREFAELSAP